MYTKFFTLAALAAVVAAVPTGSDNVCNVGSLQCCNSVQDAKSVDVQNLMQIPILGDALAVAQANNIPVGLTCNPVSVDGGMGGNSCSAQPVCCENNSFNGVVAIGCTPINVNV